MDHKEIIKERIKILPEALKIFVLDENWRREAEKIGRQFNLNEEKYASLENEIFLVLLGFEPKVDFAENTKKELQIDANMTSWMVEDVEKNIFSKVTNEIAAMWQTPDKEDVGVQNNNLSRSQHINKVGTEFEQIILNQARAMKAATPANLPTSETGGEKPRAIHNYVPGSDPYREPIG